MGKQRGFFGVRRPLKSKKVKHNSYIYTCFGSLLPRKHFLCSPSLSLNNKSRNTVKPGCNKIYSGAINSSRLYKIL